MPSLMPLFWRKQKKVELLRKLLTPSALHQAIKADPNGIRLLDCAFVPQPRPASYKYGNFDPPKQRVSENLLPWAYYLGQFDHYPREIFERYAQNFGLKQRPSVGDLWTRIVLGSVRFAGLLAGGRSQCCGISRCKHLDVRSQTQFEGREYVFEPLLTTAHRAGAINICAMNFVNTEGTFKSSAEIRELVQNSGLVIPAKAGKKLITFGNTGMLPSMLAAMLHIEYGLQIGDLCMYIGRRMRRQKVKISRSEDLGHKFLEESSRNLTSKSRRRLAETFHDFKQTSLWAHVARSAAFEKFSPVTRAQ
uniref:Rhodanese domain-containing protein n=1 Tax=Globodera rostochiensis TaxID=31243 RepID=A0A914GWJ1_GLORO